MKRKISTIKTLDQGISTYIFASEIGVGTSQIHNLRKRTQDERNKY